MGHGETTDVFLPRSVSALQGKVVQNVACGDTHTLVTTDDGVLYAFGRNQNGQLGLGNNDDAVFPRVVEKLKVCAPLVTLPEALECRVLEDLSQQDRCSIWCVWGNGMCIAL